jgi:tRNA(Ile)-lysidine synthase
MARRSARKCPPAALHAFEESVARLVRRERLLGDGDRVVVALSGGPDSTALLAALAVLRDGPGPRLRITAAHLDHGLRPGSAGDARAARALARSLGVPFRGRRLRGLRARARGSLEQAARRERYAFLAAVARREKAAAVAVAHHRDDRAETVLHRLLQGGAVAGLAGIPLRRALPGAPGCEVVRPLFEVDRADVLAYLRDRGLPSREDPTNLDGSNARGRLRTEVLPALLGAYPHARRSLLLLGETARDAALLVERDAAREAASFRAARGSVAAPRAAFAGKGPSALRRLLVEALRRSGHGGGDVPRAAVQRMAAALAEVDGRTRRVPIRDGIEVAVARDEVRLRVRG